MQRFAGFGNLAFAALVAAAIFSVGASPLSAADLPLRPPPAKTLPPAKTPPPVKTAPPAKTQLLERTDQKANDDFAGLAANCLEATDGCRTFRRAADGRFDPLNNIGIACQPKAPVCTSSR